MSSPNLAEFQESIGRIKKDIVSVFLQGFEIPIPGNELVLKDLVRVEHLDCLPDYIDHFHAPYLPPYPDFSPNPNLPLGRENPPTLPGLVRYLEQHWLPGLLRDDVEGLGLHFVLEEDNDQSTTFSVGIHVTEEAVEHIPAGIEPKALLYKLYEEMEGRDEPPDQGRTNPSTTERT